MTKYNEIKQYLEKYPKGRERESKNRFIAWILEQKYEHIDRVSIDSIEILIVDASSYDRAWRQVLQYEPELRGTDYNKKDILEQKKELELGYVPGYHQDIKKLNTL